MNDLPDKALLPTGMQDGLPPEAANEARAAQHLVSLFDSWGYARVKPPLLEFEENLLFGSGQAMADQAFRVQDPVSQRMMALRPDMTLQVARIAHSRLSQSPRPLSLADRKSTRLNSSHITISYAVFCLKKKNIYTQVKKARCSHSKEPSIHLHLLPIYEHYNVTFT